MFKEVILNLMFFIYLKHDKIFSVWARAYSSRTSQMGEGVIYWNLRHLNSMY